MRDNRVDSERRRPRKSKSRTTASKQHSSKQPKVRPAMRIAKAMALAGLCSRREAERWIGDGRVRVNGRTLETPACVVGEADHIEVDGTPLPKPQPVRLWRYYKPRGLVTSHNDPQGRPTVFEALPKRLGRVISVGRLDFNTEGLLLITTSGLLARHLELPSTGLLRRYRVRARGQVRQDQLDGLRDGIEIDGVRYGPIEAELDKAGGSNLWLTIGLREGKNREVRKILSHLGLEVGRLIRVSYGPFRLTDLKPGEVEIVRRKVLIDQLGARVGDALGLSDETAQTRVSKPRDVRKASSQGASKARPKGLRHARKKRPGKPKRAS